ncbi:hypothetical protein IQ37_01960 [Chryseobacterium piperi]|uniref:T9SS C-terminal target domain-containing protein n=1 Tax=Chryseobacterium piperi TaxID=558152 RepID=A0A086BLZ7_9FLAO|nr:hypothetical protein [Chryseobacterium piperi]ASW75806.1 hypothetical protein CJF12_16980 [Chryseobacterium piperi]KFF29961.1 hypothetical protein IQ37_01960 [Chryseobacterium piperi]
MRKLTLIAVTALSLTACRQNDSLSDSSSFEMQSASAEYLTASALPVTAVSGAITTNTTWSGVVEIDGIVTVKGGATLTIQPGTFIKAKPNTTNTPTGVLVIAKTGKINATGTASQPIIFTSYKLLDGDEDTTATPGDFGGVIMLGDAPTNKPTTTVIEGLSGADYQYGGTNAAHNGGTIKYARIEFGGFDLFAPNSGNEINGLTLGGVGNGTTLDHIQVSYGKDDSFEFFGGTVNASNLVSFAPDDDNFDFDFGYSGTITCALALADYNSTHSQSGGVSDTNGIELDNDGTGSTASPFTRPTVKNLTIVGAKSPLKGGLYENAIHVRRNGKLTLDNAVVTGYPVGVLLETVNSTTPVNLADLNFTAVQAHGFTFATASKVGSTTAALTIPGVTTSTSNPANLWGMSQPFFNEATAWNVSPRNCGDFQGTWTKYNFSIVQ